MIFWLTLNSFLFTLPPSNDKDFVYSSWSLDFILGQKVARLNQSVEEKPRQSHLDIWGNQVLSSPCPKPLCDEENGTPSFWLEATELLPAIHFCLYLRRRLARGKDGKSLILDNMAIILWSYWILQKNAVNSVSRAIFNSCKLARCFSFHLISRYFQAILTSRKRC